MSHLFGCFGLSCRKNVSPIIVAWSVIAVLLSVSFPDRRREQFERFEYQPISLATAAHRWPPRGFIRRAYDVVPQRPRSVVQRYGLRNRQFEFDFPIRAVHTCVSRFVLFLLRLSLLASHLQV